MKKMWLFSLGIAMAGVVTGCCCCNQPACVEEDVIIVEPAKKKCKGKKTACCDGNEDCKKGKEAANARKGVAMNIAGCGSENGTCPAPQPVPQPAPAAE